MIRLAENTNKFLNRFLFEEVLGLPLPAVGSLHFAARCSLGPAALRALVCRPAGRPCFGSSACGGFAACPPQKYSPSPLFLLDFLSFAPLGQNWRK
ncbi:hypothetical protein SGRA_3938 [Saprospira grandis str. Lewin]|uniref:Uncharacterized protein n=1 Tax=Saprospira grandis (strain Lewin) TaxID=984262 RepID=H6L762_SAPGL|nr:hypothetical protein SGRA_3938 [Saprospira grandis str. Lewin]